MRKRTIRGITFFALLLPLACGEESPTSIGTAVQSQEVPSKQRGNAPALAQPVHERTEAGIAQDPIPVPAKIHDPGRALERILSQQIPPYDPRLAKRPVSRLQVERFIAHFSESSSSRISTPLGPGLSLADLDGELLNGFGLDKNDRIVGISGMGIDSPERLGQILQILTFLEPSGVFNLSVLRGDDVVPISYVVDSDRL